MPLNSAAYDLGQCLTLHLQDLETLSAFLEKATRQEQVIFFLKIIILE